LKPWIDLYLIPFGFTLYVLRGFMLTMAIGQNQILFNIGIYKLGLELRLIRSEDNLCQETESARRR